MGVQLADVRKALLRYDKGHAEGLIAIDGMGAEAAPHLATLINNKDLSRAAANALAYLAMRSDDPAIGTAVRDVLENGVSHAKAAMRVTIHMLSEEVRERLQGGLL